MPERKSFFCRTSDAGEMSRPAVFGCGNWLQYRLGKKITPDNVRGFSLGSLPCGQEQIGQSRDLAFRRRLYARKSETEIGGLADADGRLRACHQSLVDEGEKALKEGGLSGQGNRDSLGHGHSLEIGDGVIPVVSKAN
jgi:hypothetical protein